MELPNSGTCWKTLSAYSVYPMWALKEKKPFSLQDRVVIFPVGPVSCHRTDSFLYFCFRSASFLPLIRPVSGETAHHRLMCVIAWSGLCSASRSFQMPRHQHAFLHYCWWVVTSPSPWEWVADTGAVGYWISVQSGPVISCRLWSAPAAPQRSAGNSTLVSYWFLPFKVKIFPEGYWRFAHAAGQESDSYYQSH